MKIKLSKTQWEAMGKQAGWMKKAMLTHILEAIKMQGNEGLNIGSMSFEELQDAKQYEKAGIVIKKDGKYFINNDHSPNFEKSKKYMEDLSDDNVSRRRSVIVTMSDGDTITTDISGTKKAIMDHYLPNGKGIDQDYDIHNPDKVRHPVKVEFIK